MSSSSALVPPAPAPGAEPRRSLAFVDRSLRLADISEAMAALVGQPAGRLRGRRLGDALPAWAPDLEPSIRRVMATAAPVVGLLLPQLGVGPGRASPPCLASCYPVQASGGYVAGVDLVIAPEGAPEAVLLPWHELAAVASERARLLEAEREARERAERLQAVTTAVSGATTPAEVYDAVVRYGVGATGAGDGVRGLVARSSTLYLLAGDQLELAGWGGLEPMLLDSYRRIPLDAPIPIADAIRSGQPVWIRSKADYGGQYPHLREQIALLATEAAASLPIEFERRALGVLTFTFEQPRAFDADERRFLLALADQAAQAIERSRLFASLRESEERFRSVFEAIEEGFCIIEVLFDAEGRPADYRYLLANPAFERFTGMRDIAGRTIRELRPDIERFWIEIYGSVALTGETRRFESDSRVRGRWFDIYASRVGGADSRRVAVVFNNITERKLAEDRLREREARLRAVLEHSGVAIWAIDADYRLIMANSFCVEAERARSGHELQLGEVMPPAWAPPPVRDELRALYARALAGTPVLDERVMRASDGELLSWETTFNPIVDTDGHVLGVTCFGRDNTHRKRAEAAMLRRSAQLQRLAQAAVGINAARDIPAALELVTAEARALIGAHQALTSAEVGHGQPANAVALSEQYAQWRGHGGAPGVAALVRQTNRPLRLTRAELVARPEWWGPAAETGGHLPPRGLLAVPLVGRDGRNLGLIQLFDKEEGEFSADDEAIMVQLAQLTAVALEQQQLYEEEQRARAAAEAAVRMREEFLSIASHELRTPLTLVLTHAQSFQRRALREGGLGERDERSLRQIITHAGRLNRMIGAMLDVSRIDQGRLQLERAPLDLSALVREAVAAIHGTAPLHLLVLTGADAPLWIVGDALRLEQALHNLLGNALKYSPNGGTVAVSLAADEAMARVTVRDEGIGIPARDLPHVFERFYRAGNVSADTLTGVGIGLFIVQEVVALHGGTVAVESEEGVGSTFTLALPRASGGVGRPASARMKDEG